MTDKAKIKARVEFLYRTKYLPTYLMFIALYPFDLEDLPGEIWRWIEGCEGRYQISNFGRVKSMPNCRRFEAKILKPWLNRQGYLIIDLCINGRGKHFPVHQLVARAFIPNPENKPEPNHEDGNKLNNFVGNLKWVTRAENVKHSFEMGLQPKGEDAPNAKLTNAQREEIRQIVVIKGDPEFGINALARKYGVTQGVIRQVLYGYKAKKRKKKD